MASLFAAFEDVERLVARTVTEAASAVVESTSEFPKPSTDSKSHAQLVVPVSTALAAQQAKKAQASWEEFDWQDQQVQWRDALQQLQAGSSSAGALTMSQLSQQLQDLYTQLLALPDPLPAVKDAAALTAKTQELEASNRSLISQLHSLQQDQAEVSQLLADYRATQAAHAALQAAHTALQEELSSTKSASNEAHQLQQQVEEQASTIRSLQATLSSMRTELETSQSSLFELTARQEQAAGSASTAEQLAGEEVERLSAELLVLRKETVVLQRQLAQLQQQQQEEGLAGEGVCEGAAGETTADDSTVNEQRTAAAAGASVAPDSSVVLQAALAAAEEAARGQQHQVALLTSQLSAATSRCERLAGELQRRPAASAVSAMVQQLAALSALAGKQLESEGWGEEAAAAAVAAVASDPLEQIQPLLQERCTKLEHALYAAKSDAAAATQSASAAAEQVQALQAQLQQSQQLVKQLEADLLAFSTSSSSGLETGTAFLTAAAGAGGADMVSGRSGLEGLVHNSTADQQEAGSPTAVNVAAAAGTDAAAAVLQAVTAQRDRFRARMSELEAEQAGVAARLQQALAQVDAVTKDNVALVEKIRFLEHYKHSQGLEGPHRQGSVTVIRVDGAGVIHDAAPGFSSSLSQNPGATDPKAARYGCGPLSLEVPGRKAAGRSAAAAAGSNRRRHWQAGCFGMLVSDDVSSGAGQQGPEARYLKEYEARLNPFSEFQASESEARVRDMRLHDKALLAGGRLIAGSKLARAAIALYVLLLHGIIMALMYASATPHVVLAGAGGSSSTPSAVAAVQGGARGPSDLAGAAVDGLQRAAAANAASGAGGGGARLLLQAVAMRPVPLW